MFAIYWAISTTMVIISEFKYIIVDTHILCEIIVVGF